MRKLAITLALATTALSTPALARDKSWYVGVEGGAMLVEDAQYDVGATPKAVSTDHRAGFDVDGVIGYDFGGFRAEAEVGYRQADVTGLTSGVTVPGYASSSSAVNYPAGTYNYAGGKDSALSFMVNGLLDFGDESGIQGFVGGGVGVARVSIETGLNTIGSTIDDSDTVFAWQGIAGIRAPLSDNLDLTLKYRFFNADSVKVVDIAGRTWDGRFRSHSILGGIIYNFGAPAAAPEPTPAPPPPAPEPAPAPAPAPAPEVVRCTPGPYIVFFDWDKSDITPEAAGILDNAISNYQSCGNASIMLAGYTDSSGSASYNVGLSQRRADSVKAYMVGHGLPEGVISTEAFGETHQRVQTADGVRELQNRRVEITYGPGSGM